LQKKKGNLKQVCFFIVNSSNFAGFLEKNCQILDITKLGGKRKRKPGLGAGDFAGANFRHFVKNILSKDYSAANSAPFQIVGWNTIKIFANMAQLPRT
jgi:hypothetical protein